MHAVAGRSRHVAGGDHVLPNQPTVSSSDVVAEPARVEEGWSNVDATRLDRISRLFADRRLSRRAAVRQGSAGLAAAGLAAAGPRSLSAQNATPDATPGAEGHVGVPFMFVQT